MRLVHYGVDPYLDSADRRQTRLDQLRMSNLDLNFSVNDRDGICPHAISQGMPVGSPVVPSLAQAEAAKSFVTVGARR